MKPLFENLNKNYPLIDHPCNGPWQNQCAIRMSIALIDSGINLTDYSDPKCEHGHARGAESLANWIWKKWGPPRIYYRGAKGKTSISGLTGIVFFKDCFTRPNETRAIGDHIDLWIHDGARTYDDPRNVAKQLWFWRLT